MAAQTMLNLNMTGGVPQDVVLSSADAMFGITQYGGVWRSIGDVPASR
jgi:hypothetical protein